MYFPERTHVTPAEAGLPEASEVPLTTADGVQIRVWHVPPKSDKPVILYFHGNGGALNYRVERFRQLIAAGIGSVGVEYRGYGGLPGSPSERGLIRDAEAAYAFAVAHYPAQQIVVWGESLGSAVAVALAAEKPVGRVILEAPFTSALAVAERRYWYLPVRLLMKDQFRSDQRIKQVTAPLLILHGMHDRVVPLRWASVYLILPTSRSTSCASSTAATKTSTTTARSMPSPASSPAIWIESVYASKCRISLTDLAADASKTLLRRGGIYR